MHILIVEDEKKTAAFISRGLTEDNFTTDVVDNGQDGLDLALKREYDLIILDVMLPAMEGWEVLKRLRERGSHTPVLLLTALDGVEDRVKGLQLGADDYLTKPFAFSELLARVQTILRRGPIRVPEVLTVGDLEIDFPAHRVSRQGKRIDLTPKEFSLLSLLARRRGEVLSRTRIAEQIWSIDFESDTNVVDVHMRRLRMKVDDPFEAKLIRTVRGVGYVLDEV
ncbi:heavy metal response regulator transcription factor [Geomonas sp. Red32]|uniref:heavy metal response regulator transcription factor n=1 Tax=Geomonas sp. Red32 TaxID=2912856 RepID=UPI00202CC3E1|nr:heavy metal response regulator transcription factor [Geomonas sp. Red32]MCM0083750.1 heavy metal response regulator transcription factor [Geomonas sp. Red32]